MAQQDDLLKIHPEDDIFILGVVLVAEPIDWIA